jgi:hypothetical protein|tara:strand:+ start:3740 stop:3898 length:159 start_codon:yes stop_codon:yes gene_type:complete
MTTKTKELLETIIGLPEFERKEIISVLIASMLNSESYEDAKKTYDEIIEKLS